MVQQQLFSLTMSIIIKLNFVLIYNHSYQVDTFRDGHQKHQKWSG